MKRSHGLTVLVSQVLLLALCYPLPALCASAALPSIIVAFANQNEQAFGGNSFEKSASCLYTDVGALNATYDMQMGEALWRQPCAARKNIYVLYFPDNADISEIASAYAASANIEMAFPNDPMSFLADPVIVTPNDFWYNHIYTNNDHTICQLDSITHTGQWTLPYTRYDRAWAITQGDSNVVVAVMDSGLDWAHPEIMPLVSWNTEELAVNGGFPGVQGPDSNGYAFDFCGYDFADNDNNVFHDPHWWQLLGCEGPDDPDLDCYCCKHQKDQSLPTECNGYPIANCPPLEPWGADRHGTVMSGIISAATNNDTTLSHRGNIAGITWQCKILPLKVAKHNGGYGVDVSANLDDAIEAINYVYDLKCRNKMNIKVLNMSVTMDFRGNYNSGASSLFGGLFAALRTVGILPVGGAGNWGDCSDWEEYCDRVIYPCRDPNVLCTTSLRGNRVKMRTAQTLRAIAGYNLDNPITWPTDDRGNKYHGVDVCGYGSECPGAVDCNGEDKRFPMCLGWEPWNHTNWSFCNNGYYVGEMFESPDQWHIAGCTPMFTSGTTAQASGLSALVFSLYPELTPAQVVRMIRRGAVSVDSVNAGYAGRLGKGVMDAYRTLTLWGDTPSDTTLTGKVYVGGDVVVPDSCTLTIAAGTEIFIAPDDVLAPNAPNDEMIVWMVHGALNINGTAENPVTIHSWATNDTMGSWTGLIVDEGATASLSHVIVKNAVFGLSAMDRVTMQDCVFDSCMTGVGLYTGGSDTSVIRNVTAKHCITGFTMSYSNVELDGCRADSNVYGYNVSVAAAVKLHNSQACYNTLDGVFCTGATDIGPDVLTAHNGRHGVFIESPVQNVVMKLDGIASEDNVSGSGIRVDSSVSGQRIEVSNCALRRNARNASAMSSGWMVLGDVANNRGMNNSLTDPGVQDVYNGSSAGQLKAENCYWSECEEGSIPAPPLYGSVDWHPYLCSDPQAEKRMVTADVPRENWSSRSYPNPFNPSAQIDYQVAENGSVVRIVIYDVYGRKVRTVIDERQPRGERHVVWDGRDDGGRVLAAGVYFYSVRIGQEFVYTGKMCLVK